MFTIVPEAFTAESGLTIRRTDSNSVTVYATPDTPVGMRYPLSEPRLRGDTDTVSFWEDRKAQMATEGSQQRLAAIIEFIAQCEPDRVAIAA